MPDYSYKAADPLGKIKSGVRFANSVNELRENLRLVGYSLISSSQGRGSVIIEALKGIQLGGITRAQLIEFCTNMAVMLNAGVPLVSVLNELREDASTGYLQVVIGDILENITAGDSLYQAMEKRPRDFDTLFINLIKIGEETGQLSEIFLNIAKHYKRIDDLIRNVRKAMLYPAFVLVALLLAAFVFLTMVFPPLFTMLNQFEVELPMITKIVMGVSSSLKDFWVVYIGGSALLVVLVIILRKYKPTRYWFDWFEIKTFFIRNVFLQLHMTFFLRYLALMLTAGVDILRGLDLSARSVTNLVVQKELLGCRQRIIEGAMFSQSLRQIRFIPNTVIRMVAVGETSGNLPEQMDYLANVYNERLERVIGVALAMLEPILVFTMAGLALSLIMGVLLPLYNMISTLSTGVGSGGF